KKKKKVGQCGIGMGYEFWKHLNEEAILNPFGEPDESHPFHDTQIGEFQEGDLSKYDYELQIFYKEVTPRKKYVPRCLFVDLEESCIDKVIASEHGKFQIKFKTNAKKKKKKKRDDNQFLLLLFVIAPVSLFVQSYNIS
ncbi:Tubulin, Beta family member (tbb-6), partial [Reticulomyxa filosa]